MTRFRFPRLLPFLLAAAAAACADAPEDVLTPDDPAADADYPPDVETVLVRTPDGVRRLRFAEVDGRAIYDGDIDLGPIDEVRGSLFGGAIHKDMGRRWPNGVVRFRFADDVPSGMRTSITNALTGLEAVSPVNFVNIGASTSGDYIEYHYDGGTTNKGVSDSIGMDGGGQDITFSTPTPGSGLILHETLHAVGFWHEQSRPDRDAFVLINESCINSSIWPWEDDRKQYEIKDDALAYGPYDYRSIMHYRTGTWCVSPRPASCTLVVDSDGDGTTESWCNTMLKKDGTVIAGASSLSREDLNMLWRMYGDAVGSNQGGERFGKAIATGDFDGDGYLDVAVGVPDEDIGDALDAGRVHVFRGTSHGLAPWKSLSQASGGFANDTGDHFGAALAAGDVDGDGKADLLVGIPNEDISKPGVLFIDSGAALLFKGSPSGFTTLEKFTQAGSEQTGDNFGAAVAIGKLGNLSTPEVIIGAPGDRHANATGGTVAGGTVWVFHLDFDPDAFAGTPTRLFDVNSPSGARFGAALAVGTIDTGGNVDLVVGAPATGAGAAYVYAGRTPGAFPPSWTTTELATFKQRLAAPAGADDFGAALAVGNVRGTTQMEVAVGAPMAEGGSGRVYLYAATTTTLGSASMSQVQTIDQNGSLDADDRFGSALAIGELLGGTAQAELVVGAPGENGGEGAVSVYTGGTSTLVDGVMLRQSNVPILGVNEAGDQFGAALAIAHLDGAGESGVSSDDFNDPAERFADLVVGTPGEAPENFLLQEGPEDSGALFMFRGSSNGPVAHMMYTQTSSFHD